MAQELTTELEAVNDMLGTTGESPISTLEVSGFVDAERAKSILNSTSREVQEEGWHFNTDEGFTLTPTVDNFINLPGNVLQVDTTKEYNHIDVVQRGTRLYNKGDQNYLFTTPIKVDIVWFLPFNELPEAARIYIKVRAARIFQDQTLDAESTHVYTEKDETTARAKLDSAELRNADLNLITGSHSAYRVVNRRI